MRNGKLRAFFWSAPGTDSTWDPLASVKERREVSMAQKGNFTTADRREAERLDLEMHARLEAGLIAPASDPVSATQPAPTVEHQHPESPSFWQAIKTMFK